MGECLDGRVDAVFDVIDGAIVGAAGGGGGGPLGRQHGGHVNKLLLDLLDGALEAGTAAERLLEL